ncbi:MAG TPA: hypothetical protein ENK57_13920 [Polyangiaceae bacterium]|nr:hypothetical protein [Polyangiaceae bacterium]
MDSAVQYGVEPGALRVEPEPARVPGTQSILRGGVPSISWDRVYVDAVPELVDRGAFGVRCVFDEPPSPLIYGEE